MISKTRSNALKGTACGSRACCRSDATQSHGFYASTAVEENDGDPEIAHAVARAQIGDMEAFRFLYLRYKNNVYGYVLSILGDEHDAEDATQYVFLKLMSAIRQYEPRTVPFTAWIIRVARNVAVDCQRQRRTVLCEEVWKPPLPADESDRDRRWGLEHALETLPPDQRGVLMLRHLVGLSPTEIAAQMGRTEASIHGLHHRARQALRRELERIQCTPTTQVEL
jgi:RNA polymerase sigma-70 factor, ECF subfamily